MKMKSKQEKGITLIALIITIVALVILTAVSVRTITNERIISHATNGAQQYSSESKKEDIELRNAGNLIEGTLTKLNDIQQNSRKMELRYTIESGAFGCAIVKVYPTIIGDNSENRISNIKSDDDLKTLFIDLYKAIYNTEGTWNKVLETWDVPEEERDEMTALDFLGVDNIEEAKEVLIEECYIECIDILSDIKTDDDLKNLLVEWAEIYTSQKLTWMKLLELENVPEEEREEMTAVGLLGEGDLASAKLSRTVMYIVPTVYEKRHGITIKCAGNEKTINSGKYAEFSISKNGRYEIEASTNDGLTASEIATINGVQEFTIRKAFSGDTVYIVDGNNNYYQCSGNTYNEYLDLVYCNNISKAELINTDVLDLYFDQVNGFNVAPIMANNEDNIVSKCKAGLRGSATLFSNGNLNVDYRSTSYGNSHFANIENVAELIHADINDNLYITTNHELYSILSDTKIADNVKEAYDGYYLTYENKLYRISDNELIASNVKDIGCGFYLTQNNELYKIYNNTKVDLDVKELHYYFLLTTNDQLYCVQIIETWY